MTLTRSDGEVRFSGKGLRLIKVEDFKDLTDQQIRSSFKEVYKDFNGEYIDFICKSCGSWKCSLEGKVEEAKIVSICSKCE